MVRVVVVRHAKSDYPLGVADHDRPLAPRGRADAPEAGRWLDEHLEWHGTPPRVVLSSAVRVQQTWELMAVGLSPRWAAVPVETDGSVYEASSGHLRDLIAARSESDLVLVGHNPGLHDLVLGAVPGPLHDAVASKFPTCAIAVLQADSPQAFAAGAYEVIDFVVPRG